nr:SDR family oxidoreductase [uncultured Acetatifactor sp.]
MKKIYLITGASSDIGMEFIQRASQKDTGALFYAHYRTMNARLQSLKTDLGDRMELIQADLSAPDGALRVIDAVREVPAYILHLPAGRIEYMRLRQIEVEEMQREMQLQVYSLLEIYKVLLPKMARAGYGRSVAVVTSCTSGMPPKFLGMYTMVKYALLGLVKSAAAEYAKNGILINALSPNMVETKFLEALDQRVVEMTAQQTNRGRNLTIQEVVAAIEFLLSDENSMCGENLVIG